MKNIYSFRLLILLCLFSTISFFACKKDTVDAGSGVTELLNFGPTGALHGDTIRFFGNNLNDVTEIDFEGASVSSSDFVSQTQKEIFVIVPEAAEEGFVTLKTPSGDITSKTRFNLSVAVTVSSITASARPGENITLSGNYLNWVNSITFADNKVVDTFVSQSLNELVVKVPADAQTGTLVLLYGGTEANTVETTDALKVILPVITILAPNPVKHQEEVTITGTDLDLATQVLFTGVATPVTSFESQSATQITVKVPAETQTGKVTVVAASGVNSESTTELNVLLPSFSTISPNPVEPDTDLTITGNDLDLVTGISFTGITAPVTAFKSQSPSEIIVTVPVGTLKGKLVLSVLNSTLIVTSEDVLDIKGGLPPLDDFPFAIYTDDLQNGFQNWSWAANDFYSTALVRQGDKSIKATYGTGGYEGITFHHNSGAATDAYTKLEFSIYGEAGTAGKTMNVVINGNWGGPYQVTLTEGEWTTYNINLSSLGTPNPLSEVILQSAGWSGVVHIDHVGLR